MKQTKITSILEKQRKRYNKHFKIKTVKLIKPLSKKVNKEEVKKTKEELFTKAKDMKMCIMTSLRKNKNTPSFKGNTSQSLIEFSVLKEIENELNTDGKKTPNETMFSSLNTTPMLDSKAKSLLLEGNY